MTKLCHYSSEIFIALKKLQKLGKLKQYTLNNIFPKRWAFVAPRNKKRTLFHKRAVGTSRFAHSQKRVLYLAPSSWRSLLETNQKEKRKRKVRFFEFYKDTNKNSSILPCNYIIKLKRGIKLFGLTNRSQIKLLDQELNRLLNQNLRKIVSRSINVRSQKAYFTSSYFADAISELGFDGILYMGKTSFHGNNGPILGSLNNSMIVIFEKTDRKHKIMDIPFDEENLWHPIGEEASI